MFRRTLTGAILAVVVCLLSKGVSNADGANATNGDFGRLRVRAVVVASDLSLRPVPKHRFLIVPNDGEQEPIEATTGFDGEIWMNIDG